MTEPRHLWIAGNHYVETSDRRVKPGKVYSFVNRKEIVRVVDIEPADEPETQRGVERGNDTVTVKILYTFESSDGLYGPVKETRRVSEIQRHQLETDKPIKMGDGVPIPFEQVQFREKRPATEALRQQAWTIDRNVDESKYDQLDKL